jgi:hypothetical protein
MTAPSRRARIEALLAEEPRDAFLRYSLATELAREGDLESGLAWLRGLMAEAPPYVPAFFLAGRQLAAAGRTDEARAVLRDGVEHARQQGDFHAAGEMSEFLAGLSGQE